MNERQKLLNRVMVSGFIIKELNLYLDTHPTDAAALGMLEKYIKMLEEAKKEYVAAYGPLTVTDYSGSGKFDWISSPWPWQYTEGK